jgi:hypothetical protein
MPSIPITNKPNGPIPGENYTSDTKNYPWHRPPDHSNLDDAIIGAMKQLTTKEGTYGLLNTLQLGITIVQAATMFCISGIGAGKWTVDHAILLAGPVAKIMQIMADGAKIKYSMGLEGDPIPTSSYFDAVKSVDQESVSFAQEAARKQVKNIHASDNGTPNPVVPPPADPTAPEGATPSAPPAAGGGVMKNFYTPPTPDPTNSPVNGFAKKPDNGVPA